MTWSSRSTRVALLAYVLLAVLILGGVTWGTVSTIRYERTLAEMLHGNQARSAVNQALSRMANMLVPILSREAARPYWHYVAYSLPHLYRLDGTLVNSDAYLQPSPLINHELEPWITLHFQLDAYGTWQSPQAPMNRRFATYASIATVDPVVRAERLAVLDHLRETVSYDELASLVEQNQSWAIGDERALEQPTRCIASICERWFDRDIRLRSRRQREMQSVSVPQQLCEHESVVLSNLLDRPTYDASEGPPVAISVSEMTPVWLGEDANGQDQLAFVRQVKTDIEGLESLQGFLVNWDRLRQELLSDVSGLDFDVDIVPVKSVATSVPDWPITGLPAALVVTPPSGAELSLASKLLLALVWCAALAILGGLGLGIRNLLALTERRTQFAYAVTHELRTPLTTLRLYTDMLASGLVRPEDRDRYVGTLNVETERLSDLVDEVLEYARVENRRVKLDVQPINVSQLLESIREHCDARCEKAGKRLVVEVNGLARETVHTDPHLVRQVVTNLVDNACKYTRGADDPTILVRALRQLGDRISIDIEDRGPGIDARQKQFIFKPFRRGRVEAGGRTGGIGLGLALARSWTRLLNGRLELVSHSSDGCGACFRLTIPKTA